MCSWRLGNIVHLGLVQHVLAADHPRRARCKPDAEIGEWAVSTRTLAHDLGHARATAEWVDADEWRGFGAHGLLDGADGLSNGLWEHLRVLYPGIVARTDPIERHREQRLTVVVDTALE